MSATTGQTQRAEEAILAGCRAVIDIGDGPRTLLIAAPGPIEAADETVVPADSPLGRALIGARVGDRVRFRTPTGPRMARVVALRR